MRKMTLLELMQWIKEGLKEPKFQCKDDMRRFYAGELSVDYVAFDVVKRLQEIFSLRHGEIDYCEAYYGNLALWHSLPEDAQSG